MSTTFIIRNHLGQFLSKQQEWVDGGEPAGVFVARHKDQAINTLVEVNSRDIELRCQVVEVATDEKGRPALADITEDFPAPQPAPHGHAGEALAESGEEEPDQTEAGDNEARTDAPVDA